ncbi:transglutaminase domain-containing protein [Pedobacter puniceum]|uniref:DUF3857 domain-containing protein n=1 Tax=Pedobacter puniceum TaxID=2666136 RepID=A0A7K0FP22_9SPHI|nr:DUF3857 domain-containing protein [Pedobacter puniceum]MRX47592.1 DUF3857 domain-containing protein [Pedobacter puniceum]
MKKRLLVAVILFLTATTSISTRLFAQDEINKGWTAFLNNNTTEASNYFKKALESPSTKSEALLGLAFTSSYDKDENLAFNYFNDFYKSHPNPEPYLLALWSSSILNNTGAIKKPTQLSFYQSIVQKHDLDGALSAMAYGVLGSHFQSQKMFKESEEMYAKIGSLTNWQVLGEFENISTSGFDKTYDALSHPEPDFVFKDKRGAKVNWFTPTHFRKDKWIDFTNYFSAGSAIVFAQTFVESPIDQEIQLRVGVSGSLKVWLNDFLIISEEDERNNDLDSYIREIKLNKGFNRILVQVGESYAGRSNFLVRLTDKKGNPIPTLNHTPKSQTYSKAVSYNTKEVKLKSHDFFATSLNKGISHQILQILSFLREDRTYEARKSLELLKKDYPKSTYLNILFTELFNRTDNRTGLESTQESIKANDPEHPVALTLAYEFYASKKDFVKMDEYLKKLEDFYGPNHQTILTFKIGYHSLKNEVEKLVSVVEKSYQLYPDRYEFVELKFLVEKEIKKNNNGAIAVIKKYLKTYNNYNASKLLANLYISTGAFDKGIEVLVEESTNNPISKDIYLDIIRQYYQVQNYAKAKEFELKVLELSPYTDVYHLDIAKINKSLGKKDEAIAAYKKVLELNPNNYDAIKELREMQGKKPLFNYFEKVDISKALVDAPKQSDYPDDECIILIDEVQTIIHSSGGSEERYYMLAKILNSKGVENWKEYTVSASSRQRYLIEEAVVIKASGQKVPGEINDQDIVFTNLEVGDAIYVNYRVENYSQGQLANKFWDTYYFSHYYPYKKTKYSLLVAQNIPLQYKFSQKNIEPLRTKIDDYELYVFENINQEGLKYEDKMPSIEDVANILYLSTIPDWRFVSNWYYDMASAKARPNYEVKETVKNLLANQKGVLSDYNKAKLIYDYITSNITYSSVPFRQSGLVPQEPATVLNTLIGDCKDVSTLFVTMCKEAGLNANLVLVNTRDNGTKSLMLPSIDFNHCIAKINLNNKPYYLELTSSYLPFGSLYNSSLQSIILDIDDSKNETTIKYLNPDTRLKNNISRKVDIKLNSTDLLIKEENFKVSSKAASVRETYAELSEKDKSKTMLEGLRGAKPMSELTSLKFKNLDKNTSNRDSVFTTIEYTIKDDIKTIGGMQIITLPWSNQALASDINITDDRKFPIDFTNVYGIDYESEVITLELPQGKTIIENIPSVSYQNAYINYSLKSKIINNKLVFERKFEINKDMIGASEVKDFMDTYKKIILADSKQLAIK